MKKITLVLLAVLVCTEMFFAQVNILVKAPPGNNATTQVRAPNGNASHTTMRGCFLVSAAELTPYMLPGTNISSFGFTLTAGVSGAPVTGNFTVYLQNTNDNTYQKGTSFSNAITGMSNSYTGNLTIPVSASSTSMSVTLGTPFSYTGGGLYVAYDWASSGPFSSTVATYMADNSISPGGASNSSTAAPASDAMGTTAFRPVFLFGAANTATNDVQVLGIEAPGSVAPILNTAHVIRAVVKNGSNTTLSNFPVYLNVSGANPFTSTVTIASLAAGATTTVNFPSYNPQLAGVNTISVSVDPDQLNNNNSRTYMQTVNCNIMGQGPQPATYTSGVGFNTASGIIAARLTPPVNVTLTAVRLAISSDLGTVGKSLYGVLMNSTGGIIATTNTITVTAGQLSTLQTFSFAAQQNLTGGVLYHIGMAQPAGSAYFPVGASPAGMILPSNLYVTSVIGGGSVSTLTTNLGYFGIDAIIKHNTTIGASASSTLVCSGSTVNLSGSGASTYTWSNGMTGASVVLTPTAPSNYTVTGTAATGCTASATTSLNVVPGPSLSVSPSSTLICAGNSATLSAQGADTYTWSTSSNSSSIAVSPAATSNYSVEGTDNNTGCVTASVVTINVDSPTIAISGPAAICQGSSAVLNGSGALTYTWSTGASTSSITVNPGATAGYTLEGTSAAGCYDSEVVTLTVNPTPSISVVSSTSLLCEGSSATLTASGGSVYSWSGSISSGPVVVISPTLTTSYTVTGSNSFGCSSTATITQNVTNCTGLSEHPANFYTVYPNPSSGIFNVIADQGAQFEVYSLLGKKVSAGTINASSVINLESQPAGVYFITFNRGNSGSITVKLVKQ